MQNGGHIDFSGIFTLLLLISMLWIGARRTDWYKVNPRRDREFLWIYIVLGMLVLAIIAYYFYTRFIWIPTPAHSYNQLKSSFNENDAFERSFVNWLNSKVDLA